MSGTTSSTAQLQPAQALRLFLARVIELSERIQTRMAAHADPEELERLYQARRALFEHADPRLAQWIQHAHLTPADAWSVYKQFLLALEDEHVAKQYKAQDQALSFEDFSTVHANPFLLQQDSADDKSVVDEAIEKRRLTAAEIVQLMANLSPRELLSLILLAKGLQVGSFWDHKYDL